MSDFGEWDSFYVIVGGAAGALIGLQFVVIDGRADRVRRAPAARRIFRVRRRHIGRLRPLRRPSGFGSAAANRPARAAVERTILRVVRMLLGHTRFHRK